MNAVLEAQPKVLAPLTPDAAKYRVQILLSEVVDQPGGRSTLRRSAYRAGEEYFYPASAIKLCAAVAAVQKLEALAATQGSGTREPDLNTPIAFLPQVAGESVIDQDPTNLDGGRITIGHEIRKLFLVSDNESFNRLYDFVGHREINERMHALGLESVVINHRLSTSRSPNSRRTPSVRFVTSRGDITLPASDSDLALTNRNRTGLSIGTGYMTDDRISAEPIDFTARNGISIGDLQDLLILIVRPDIDIGKPPLRISDAHRRFLSDVMAVYPGDSTNPKYDRAIYPDDWGKFFLPGLLSVCSQRDLVIRNKVGQAYGFTIDNAYVENTRLKRAFFLTAVIYTNEDGVLNDDKYEYEGIAFPFMANLSEAVVRTMGW